ncbi:MAG: YkgJ family cysteine cluster protein [Cryomorphaceae bacterium]|nr:MAG: YkgJ family cysteine cluster protein [Cryomorphaceae bacterium]
MNEELLNLKQRAAGLKKQHRKLVQKLQAMPSSKADELIHEAHEDVFACTDCLQCANCCKTTGPLFTDKDIERIARYLKMRPAAFIERYLRVDEDRDYVLQKVPCAFLGADNYCSIYDVRPKACREYPHTDRRNMQEIMSLTLKNAAVCPAVLNILELVREKVGK